MGTSCERCDATSARLSATLEALASECGKRIAAQAQVEKLTAQLRETLKLCALQKADLDRLRAPAPQDEALPPVLPPHKPERVPHDQLQLAFERVLASQAEPAANDDAEDTSHSDTGTPDVSAPHSASSSEGGTRGPAPKPSKRAGHGRRDLSLSSLPAQSIVIDPDEVIAAHGEGYRLIEVERSDRLAFRPSAYIRLELVRRKWARIEPSEEATIAAARAVTEDTEVVPELPAVVIAPLPACLSPRTMADASAIAQHIVAKYEDCLPLHRQEKISERHGFGVPRGTQCGWLKLAFSCLHGIVEAMFADAKATAVCIATDATGVPVRRGGTGKGPRDKHHVFVFLADQRHVVFQHSPEHNGTRMQTWLAGYTGYLLADASSIYDVVYRLDSVLEAGCWAHARRYFWKALGADPDRATEAIAIIGKLFEVQRECADIPMPERTRIRAAKALPILRMMDAWIERHRAAADARGPLRAAITYYDNQREALRRFLEDGRLRLDNNLSEAQLRRLVLGRANWGFFANTRGLDWYVTFRSLIASCRLHQLNPQTYLEQVLRLARHWPQDRMLELSPACWADTLQKLTPEQRAIVTPLWEQHGRVVQAREAVAAAA